MPPDDPFEVAVKAFARGEISDGRESERLAVASTLRSIADDVETGDYREWELLP